MLETLISSAAFGFAHVVLDIDYGNLLGIAQGIMKTLECGMFAFVLCVPVLEGRNIVGAITAHAFYDWILLVARTSEGKLPTAKYMMPNERAAIAAIVIWAVFCLLYLPKVIQSFRRFNAMRLPQYGPFVAESQSARLANTAWNDEKEYQSQPHKDAVDAHIGSLRDHRVFNHRGVTILATLICYLMISNLITIVGLLIFGEGGGSKVIAALGGIAASFVMLLGYQRHFGGRPDGLLGWTTTGVLLVLPSLLFVVSSVAGWTGATFNNPLVALVLAVASGLSEEIIYRVVPASNWMRVGSENRDIMSCVVVTSLAFALINCLNLFVGAPLSAIIFQVFYTFCLGTLFCAVFLSTGSVWPSVILHAVINLSAFLVMDLTLDGVLYQEVTLGPSFWLTVVASIVSLGWAAWLLRPTKQAEIAALWKKRWRKGQKAANRVSEHRDLS